MASYFAVVGALFALALLGGSFRDPALDSASDVLQKRLTRTFTHRPSLPMSPPRSPTRNARAVLPTPWTGHVDPHAPLPEYPRPQMQRPRWKNLNGVWEFETSSFEAHNSGELPFNRSLSRQIVVPFPVESPLSGIHEHHSGMAHMLYRTNFSVPDDWMRARAGGAAPRLLLHFGAVDWEAKVYIDRQYAGTHRGGYDSFTLDATPHLRPGGGPHQLLLSVYDPTEFAHIAVGKQRLHPPRHPSSIWYTSCSGIWRTVWMEPVPAAYITRLDLVPDIDAGSLAATVHVGGAAQQAGGLQVRATASVGGEQVAQAIGRLGEQFSLSIPAPLRLWSPDSPSLYDLEVELLSSPAGLKAGAGPPDGAAPIDAVTSYFGMRKISLGRLPGETMPRMMLNNQFLFQLGLLDQGYWPDGIYTAPTDEALKSDIVAAKRLGYNMLRKHIKVEPDRWYYWADHLGVLVWQDMPSLYWEDGTPSPSAQEQAQWEGEFERMIQHLVSFPSIVVYVVFNEGWGQYDTRRVTQAVSALDRSRLFDCASGWNDAPVGDLVDMHKYVGPDAPLPTSSRAAVLGEFGGLGYRAEGHLWIPEESFCYEMEGSLEQLEVRYLGLVRALGELMTHRGLSAAVYTELTDVEAEINGWLTYDRATFKLSDAYAVPSANRNLISASRQLGNATRAAAGRVAAGAARVVVS